MTPIERNRTIEASWWEWRLVRAGKRSSMEAEAWRPTVILLNMTHTCWAREREANTGDEIKERNKRKSTPFKSFLPEGGKMLTYLEAMRRPKKHIVNTLAIGSTAILIVPSTDSPAATAVGISMRSERIRVIIPTKAATLLTWDGIWEKSEEKQRSDEVMMIVWKRERNKDLSHERCSLSLCHVFLFRSYSFPFPSPKDPIQLIIYSVSFLGFKGYFTQKGFKVPNNNVGQ